MTFFHLSTKYFHLINIFIVNSLDHEGKERVQFGLLTNSIWSGKFMKLQLEDNEDTLDIGLTDTGEFYVELFKQRLVQPTNIHPNVWHKVTITKQHHKLSLKLDNLHQEILHLDTTLPKISISDKPLIFTGRYINNTLVLSCMELCSQKL